jgi:hypothetical protein
LLANIRISTSEITLPKKFNLWNSIISCKRKGTNEVGTWMGPSGANQRKQKT